MTDEKTVHTGRKMQTRIYLGKLFRIFIYEKDWKVIPMAAAIALMVAFVAGKRMFSNMEGLRIGSFAFVCVCIWNGFFNSIQVVCRERAIIKREHRSGLHISAYIAAHMIYQAIICLMQVVISILIYKWYGVQFPTDSAVTGIYLLDLGITLFLITYASDMMALMISCLVHTTTAAMTIMPFLLIFQLVFSGILFPLYGSTYKASYLTISKYGTFALCSASNYNKLPSNALYTALWQFESEPAVKDMIDYIEEQGLREKLDEFSSQHMQLPEYQFDCMYILKQWGMLLFLTVLYGLIGILALERIDRDKR